MLHWIGLLKIKRLGHSLSTLTLTESTGYNATCSAIPARAPAVALMWNGVSSGRLSYSSNSAMVKLVNELDIIKKKSLFLLLSLTRQKRNWMLHFSSLTTSPKCRGHAASTSSSTSKRWNRRPALGPTLSGLTDKVKKERHKMTCLLQTLTLTLINGERYSY